MMSGSRDGTKIVGPLDAATVIDMLESGAIDKESSLISNYPDGFWEEFTPDKELTLHKAVRSQARVEPLFLPAPEPQEDIKGRTEADDRNAYHLLMQIINNKCETGRALLQQADNLFGYTQSGHEFFKWLDERAKASVNDDGLINADDARQDVLDFQLPEGMLTKETIVVQGAAFKTLWFKQPPERHGRMVSSLTFSRHGLRSSRLSHSRRCSVRSTQSTYLPPGPVWSTTSIRLTGCFALSIRVGATITRR